MVTTVDELIASGPNSKVFLDTNILVYSSIRSAPLYLTAKTAIDAMATCGTGQWLSYQILREYVSAMTRQPTIPISGILKNVRDYRASFNIASDNDLVHNELQILLSQIPCRGKQVHDANIVATMLVNGIPNLFTHNVADFKRFGHLINIIPLIPLAPPSAPPTSTTAPSP